MNGTLRAHLPPFSDIVYCSLLWRRFEIYIKENIKYAEAQVKVQLIQTQMPHIDK